jgi:hypothetical protein
MQGRSPVLLGTVIPYAMMRAPSLAVWSVHVVEVPRLVACCIALHRIALHSATSPAMLPSLLFSSVFFLKAFWTSDVFVALAMRVFACMAFVYTELTLGICCTQL